MKHKFFLFAYVVFLSVFFWTEAWADTYQIKHGWKDGQDTSWVFKELTQDPNNANIYFIKDYYGGTGCDYVTPVKSAWIPNPTLVNNPQIGDSALFELNISTFTITITKLLPSTPSSITTPSVLKLDGPLTGNWGNCDDFTKNDNIFTWTSTTLNAGSHEFCLRAADGSTVLFKPNTLHVGMSSTNCILGDDNTNNHNFLVTTETSGQVTITITYLTNDSIHVNASFSANSPSVSVPEVMNIDGPIANGWSNGSDKKCQLMSKDGNVFTWTSGIKSAGEFEFCMKNSNCDDDAILKPNTAGVEMSATNCTLIDAGGDWHNFKLTTAQEGCVTITVTYANNGTITVNATLGECGEVIGDKVYFINTARWENVYVYTWNGDHNTGAWPGVPATYEGKITTKNDIVYEYYSYTVSSGMIIFNNGLGHSCESNDCHQCYEENKRQTGDLTVSDGIIGKYFMATACFDGSACSSPTESWVTLDQVPTIDISCLTVEFDLNGHGDDTLYIETKQVRSGDKVGAPSIILHDTAYTFTGRWCKNQDGSNPWDFNDNVIESMTLYAIWKNDPPVISSLTPEDQSSDSFLIAITADDDKKIISYDMQVVSKANNAKILDTTIVLSRNLTLDEWTVGHPEYDTFVVKLSSLTPNAYYTVKVRAKDNAGEYSQWVETEAYTQIRFWRVGQNSARLNVSSIPNESPVFGALRLYKNDMLADGTGDFTSKEGHYYERCMFYISFPFDVRVSDIKVTNGLTLGNSWFLYKYNGARRAQIGWFRETSSFWEDVSSTQTLVAGEGYCISLESDSFSFVTSPAWNNGKKHVEWLFPSSQPITTYTNSTPTLIVPGHECKIDRVFESNPEKNHKETDSHWNIIGLPMFEDGRIVSEETNQICKYVYEWHYCEEENGNTVQCSKLTVVPTDDFTFRAGHAYTAQYAGEIQWSSGMAVRAGVKRRNPTLSASTKPYIVTLQLLLNQKEEDKTYIELNNTGKDGFVLLEDLVKEKNSGRSNLYSFSGAYDVAANVVEMKDQCIPLGVSVNAKNTFRFHLSSPYYGNIVLIDKELKDSANLIIGDYEIELDKGTCEDRFVLKISLPEVVPYNDEDSLSDNPLDANENHVTDVESTTKDRDGEEDYGNKTDSAENSIIEDNFGNEIENKTDEVADSTQTALNNALDKDKPGKYMLNQQIFIRRNGKSYDVYGREQK